MKQYLTIVSLVFVLALATNLPSFSLAAQPGNAGEKSGSAANLPTVRRFLFPDVASGSCRAVVAPTAQPAVHTAQVLPLDREGTIVGKGEEVLQVKQTFANLAKILAAANSGLQEIVKLNVYVRDPSVSVEVQRWLSVTYSGKSKPAVSYVATRLANADALLAVDAVALTRKDTKAGIEFGAPEKFAPSSATAFGVLPSGPRVYISGQAEKGDGSLADATLKTLEGLVRSLQFCGLDRTHIVQLKAFCLPMTEAAVVEQTVAKFFAGQKSPPIVLVEWKSGLPIEIELIASSPKKDQAAPPVEFLTPPDLPASPIYSRIARVNASKIIYISGLYTGKEGRLPADEVRALFPLLQETVQMAASDLEHLVKATYYVADGEVSALLNKTRPDYYNPQRPPAASKAEIAGTGLAGHRITIDMIAVPK